MEANPGRSAFATHAVILAAGSGTRLGALTRDDRGARVPKQYCSVDGRRSMLRAAIDRAARVVPLERIVVVVAREHHGHWRRELADLPPENVVSQPRNRGTAAGILLPLLRVLERDPRATVAFLPSDHFVRDEATFSEAVRRALRTVRDGRIVLLGIVPDSDDAGYGYLLPERSGADLARVLRFVEKPHPRLAGSLRARGALWNSFVWAAQASSVLARFRCILPELTSRMEAAATSAGPGELAGLYETLPVQDFSRDVLERARDLWLVRTPPCGWSDLGTPSRILACTSRAGEAVARGLLVPGRTVPTPSLTRRILRIP